MDRSKLTALFDEHNLKRVFDRVIRGVFAIMLALITASVIIGVVHLFYKLVELILHPTLPDRYMAMITSILTLFILIELSRSLVGYFDTQRLRLTFIADAAIVFVLREIMIDLFMHKLPAADIYAYSALLFVLSALRVSSVLVNLQERRLRDGHQHRPRGRRSGARGGGSSPASGEPGP